jgi:hypothetical protein
MIVRWLPDFSRNRWNLDQNRSLTCAVMELAAPVGQGMIRQIMPAAVFRSAQATADKTIDMILPLHGRQTLLAGFAEHNDTSMVEVTVASL